MDYRLLGLASVIGASSLALVPASAHACGGFFCDGVAPVVQAAERILFHVRDDGRITTVVEIQYQGQPESFAWIVPVPDSVSVEDITVAPPGIFDDLERLSAPRFHEPDLGGDTGGASADDSASGCSGFDLRPYGSGGGDFFEPEPPDTSGVEVVGESVVGPYAIELITAEEGDNLSNWLLLNGYVIPPGADVPMQHYIDGGSAFLGVKLRPDVSEGPIDALVFDYEADVPMIPLLLTAIASAPRLEIVAYVVGREQWKPLNWVNMDFPYDSVSWTGDGETDYAMRLLEEIDRNEGRAWNTEFARPSSVLGSRGPAEAFVEELLAMEQHTTRFHTHVTPENMTQDPVFVPDPMGENLDNNHTLWDSAPMMPGPRRAPLGAAAFLGPVLLLGLRRRRR